MDEGFVVFHVTPERDPQDPQSPISLSAYSSKKRKKDRLVVVSSERRLPSSRRAKVVAWHAGKKLRASLYLYEWPRFSREPEITCLAG